MRAINEGAVPTIASAWEGVAEQQCQRASERAREVYRETLEGRRHGGAAPVRAEEAALQVSASETPPPPKDPLRFLASHPKKATMK